MEHDFELAHFLFLLIKLIIYLIVNISRTRLTLDN